MRGRLAILLLAPCLVVVTSRATGATATVATILRSRCVGCHGPEEASGGLRLDSYDMVMRGGDRGPVVWPSHARASLLLRKVSHRDKPFMPPRRPLSSAEVRSIRRWIDLGAPRW